jgi:hypothetical protein
MGSKSTWLVVVVALAAAVVPVASAGKPTIARQTVDETFPDVALTSLCGVPVETHARGHEITRSHEDGKGRLVEVFTLNIALTSTSAYGTFRFRDVGADLTRVTKDGVVVQLVGQLPFWFNGTAWFDPATGETLKGPTGADLFERMAEEACSALAP